MFQVHSQRDLKQCDETHLQIKINTFQVCTAWHDDVEEFIKIKWSSCKLYNLIKFPFFSIESISVILTLIEKYDFSTLLIF